MHVTDTGEIVNKGAHSQSNQGGIYLTRSALERHPQFAMESWRAFTAGDNALHEPPLYGANSTLLHLFRKDTWTQLDSLRNFRGQDMLKDSTPAKAFVCQAVMTGRDGRPFETGCTDPNFPSMSVPVTGQRGAIQQLRRGPHVLVVWRGSPG